MFPSPESNGDNSFTVRLASSSDEEAGRLTLQLWQADEDDGVMEVDVAHGSPDMNRIVVRLLAEPGEHLWGGGEQALIKFPIEICLL